MLSISLPNRVEDLLPILQEVLRRSVDGTVVPMVIDYANQRIYIGASGASSSPAKVEVHEGDIKVVSSGYGVVIPNRAGTAHYRLIVDSDGALSIDPI